MNRPVINVTPLIDVLLVLLIIFMVVSPIRPSAFKARIPSEPTELKDLSPNPDTLVVTVDASGRLALNSEHDLGTVGDDEKLRQRLETIFAERTANGSVSTAYANDPERKYPDQIERTVFIKAPQQLGYGKVAAIVDTVKQAGAFPISLQIDRLD